MADIILECGDTRVTIVPELGARLAQIETRIGEAHHRLLYEPPESRAERDPIAWGSYVMAPWPNRVANGRFEFEGVSYTLPTNDGGHALHGLTFDCEWRVVEVSATACELSIDLDGRWPWPARVEQRIEALDDGVAQSVAVRSLGAAFPAGVGWHPWFARPASAGVMVQVDAKARYELERMIPTGRLLALDVEHDLRAWQALGERRLDDCYAGVRSPVALSADGCLISMQSSANVEHVVVYSPAHAVCVEPQTCAIDAFNLASSGARGSGMCVVDEEHPLLASSVWRWRTADGVS